MLSVGISHAVEAILTIGSGVAFWVAGFILVRRLQRKQAKSRVDFDQTIRLSRRGWMLGRVGFAVAILLEEQSMAEPRPAIVSDAEEAANWIAAALNESGYGADFSAQSLREIERFFVEHSEEGRPKPGGLLAQDTGARLFAMGSYVGEVIRRKGGGEWVGSDDDPQAEINITMRQSGGALLWPVQRVMKRLLNGPEDNIYHYGLVVLDRRPASDGR
jgi:hypothetical protein